MKLLSVLVDALFPPRETERLVRDATEEALGALVAPLSIPREGGETVALLPYRHPLVSALVIEAKYHGSRRACELLGGVLADYLAALIEDEDAYAKKGFALLPMPLSRERARERGYNQTERIAACALARLGFRHAPDTGTLLRVRDTPSQTRLPGALRRENMKGAFRAQDIDAALAYVLVDDVITTGATFAAAAGALRDAGASRVLCVALAH